MIVVIITAAKMKSQRPGGPSLKGQVILCCDPEVSPSSAAETSDTIHEIASK